MRMPAERHRLMACLFPDNRAAGEYITDWVSMQNVIEVLTVIKTHEMAITATLDAQLQQAQDNVGTGVAPIAGKVITQLEADHADEDDVIYINLKAYELDVDNAYDYIRLRVTIANAAVDCDAEIWGTTLRYSPDAMALVTENVA